ncbi:histidine kinase N-terminal 7TM domain-containing protein, partial [Candidatus Margulisiibacteriota bacterium]
MSLENILLIINFIAALTFSTFIKLKGKKNLENNILSATIFSISLWTLSHFLMRFFTFNPFISRILLKFSFLLAAIMAMLFFNFCLAFTKRIKFMSFKNYLLIYFPIVLFYLSLVFLDPLVLKDVIINLYSQISFQPGIIYILFSSYLVFMFFFSLYFLINKYFKVSGEYKIQLLYVFVGTSISGLGIVVTNVFLVNLGISSYIWCGPFISFFWICLLTYSVTKHNLMEVKAIIPRIVSYIFIAVIIFTVSLILSYVEHSFFNILFIIFSTSIFWMAFGNKLREKIQ